MSDRYVETVLGLVNVNALGRTLTHEHLSINVEEYFVHPSKIVQELLNDSYVLKNFGVIHQYPYSSRYNLCLNDKDSADAVLEDVKFYKKSGGGTIVENTNYGINRDLSLMRRISRETGVHVIAGTGHYIAETQSESMLSTTEEQMFELIINEMTIGCDNDSSVKAGFIGEVGSSWPIEDFEKRAIRAAGQAQEQLKCPVSFHPGRNSSAPFEIMRIYMEAGGDPKKAIMSHLDRTLLKNEDILEFAKLGSYCQYDLFGIECSFYQLHPPTDMPSDAQRIDRIRILKEDGRLDRILMSHDIHTKHRLMRFGGHGYAHIINNVLPKMLIKGFTSQELDSITIDNPKNWLSR